MKRSVAYALAFTCLFGCTDADGAKEILTDQGYTSFQPKGYSWFGCGHDDTLHTAFSATSSTGRHVTGQVCCGVLFKGCTVRFDR